MAQFAALGGQAVQGIGGLLGKGKEMMGGITGGFDKAMNPGDYAEKLPEGIAGPERQYSPEEVALKKAGKQAAADKSMKAIAPVMNLADAAGSPGPSFVGMGGLLGMGQNQMGDSRQFAQSLAGNSKAGIYQKAMFEKMLRGG